MINTFLYYDQFMCSNKKTKILFTVEKLRLKCRLHKYSSRTAMTVSRNEGYPVIDRILLNVY